MKQSATNPRAFCLLAACFTVVLLLFTANSASAAILCVNPGGTGGCYKTISAAVAAASPGDTITVAAGTYNEDVVIGISLSIVGAGWSKTTVDASGLANGFYIDGLDNPKLRGVTITGFTVQNANYEGIVATNSSDITVWNNHVENNNKGLDITSATCPGTPSWETAEDFDCGEGIHISGVDHSSIVQNTVTGNSGGILISDDTGPTHHNFIAHNFVVKNPYDCGITLASHPPAPQTGASSSFGVFRNTIYNNQSNANGVLYGGAGVGIFDSVPGARNYDNVVVGNSMSGNGIPGMAMHSHTPGQTMTDNLVASNTLSGNGPDDEDAFTAGRTGINVFGVSSANGTMLIGNTINNEVIDVQVKAPGSVYAHLNNLYGSGLGVNNAGKGFVDAIENYWGCAAGPGSTACSAAGGILWFIPWSPTPLVTP